jgi:hypothetical protein
MRLQEALADREKEIVGKWVDLVLSSYQSAAFFKTKKDQFANPVGANIKEGLRDIYQLLLAGAEPAALSTALDRIIRIRAVQEFTPSQAISFVFALKEIVRAELTKTNETLPPELGAFEAAVDRSALMAFDIYMACRERLFQIRIKELQNGTHILTDGTQCASGMAEKESTQISGKQTNQQFNMKRGNDK